MNSSRDPAERIPDVPLVAPDADGIRRAAAAIEAGRLVLHPTETVVSLSGNPRDAEAVQSARALKGYEEPRPFLILVADVGEARRLAATWPDPVARLARAFWPGPMTLVVEAAQGAPRPVVADGTLALRPAADPISKALLAAFGGPVFSTSANRRGEDPALSVEEALRDLVSWPGAEAIEVGVLDAADDADEPSEVSSTIVDVTAATPRVVRVGAIGVDRIRAALRGRVEE